MIDLYLLEALVTFEKEGTLSAASEQLHISQPALSRAMQKLEEETGVPLFERSRNRLALNSTGKLCAQYAKKVLQAHDEMMEAVTAYDRSLRTLSIGFCAPSPEMDMIRILHTLYPETEITTGIDSEENLYEGLLNHTYHMIVLSYPVYEEGLKCMPCGKEQLYFSLTPDHRLAKSEKLGVRFSDMDGETMIMAQEIGIWKHIKEEMMPHTTLIRQMDMESLNTLINTSSLPGFATDYTIRAFRRQQNPNRVFVPVNDPEATVHFYCIFRKENAQRLEKWIEFAKNHFTSR